MIAVVGYGAWGRNLVRNFDALGHLGAVVDVLPAARQAARDALPRVRVASSLAELARDERPITAVAIATPAETHVALCHDALDHGLDIFCEKPLALAYADAESVARRAEASRRVLMVGHILEYHPGMCALFDVVRSGVLGELRHIEATRLHPGSARHESSLLWALAPHDIAVILRLAGRLPTRVIADGTADVAPGVPGVVALQLRFEGGLAAHVHLSSVHHFKEQRLVVVGSRRTAVFDDVSDGLTVHEECERPATSRELAGDATHVEFPRDEPLRVECQAFLDALTTRHPPRTDARSALAVVRVIEQAQASLVERAACKLT